MKVSRLFTIDVDIAERLQGVGNSSALVNELLRENLAVRCGNNRALDQKKAIASNLKKKMQQVSKEIKIFDQLEALKFDNFCIRWCLLHENPDPLLMMNYIKSRDLNIRLEKFKEGFLLVNKHGHLFEKT